MSDSTQPIHLAFRQGSLAPSSDYQSAARAIAQVRAALDAQAGNDDDARALASMLDMMQRIDAQYGADGALPVAGVDEALDEALSAAAHVEAALARHALEHQVANLDTAVLALGYWAARHEVGIRHPDMWVNALARRANAAQTRQDCAAAFALMQGAIHHLSPALSPDLERSNPERPWRILNLNFAITGIRSGDGALMRFAFDQLNRALPAEAPGFYQEAHERAGAEGFPAEHRSLIESEMRRWTRPH